MPKEMHPCIYCGEPAADLICSDQCQREHFGMDDPRSAYVMEQDDPTQQSAASIRNASGSKL